MNPEGIMYYHAVPPDSSPYRLSSSFSTANLLPLASAYPFRPRRRTSHTQSRPWFSAYRVSNLSSFLSSRMHHRSSLKVVSLPLFFFVAFPVLGPCNTARVSCLIFDMLFRLFPLIRAFPLSTEFGLGWRSEITFDADSIAQSLFCRLTAIPSLRFFILTVASFRFHPPLFLFLLQSCNKSSFSRTALYALSESLSLCLYFFFFGFGRLILTSNSMGLSSARL